MTSLRFIQRAAPAVAIIAVVCSVSLAGDPSLVAGRVVSDLTGEPLENANVFVAQTFCGTSTAGDGSFLLRPGFQGSYDLVVSLVGYDRKVIRLRLAGGDTVRLEVRLTARVLRGEGVQVLATRPEEWDRNLAAFRNAFIGPDVSVDDCVLLNPWVVDFQMNGDTLIASSDSLLRIDNRAFGYRIQGAIGEFRWDLKHDAGVWSIYPQFTLMPAVSPEQSKTWAENRRGQYLGSLRHFLRACITGRCKEEGFAVRSLRWDRWSRVKEGMIGINRWAGTSLYEWRYRGQIMGNYRSSRRPGYLRLVAEYALIDSTGFLVTPFAMELGGLWGEERVGSILPVEYTPGEN